MPSNQQRRDAERRRLQRQLEQRRARESARKRTTLIASIVGTLVVIAAVVVVVVVSTRGSGDKSPAVAGGGNGAPSAGSGTPPAGASTPPAGATTTPDETTTTPPTPTVAAPAACTSGPKNGAAKFDGVTVTNPTDLSSAPKVTSTSSKPATRLECQDLVVGTGKAASPTAKVTVQYTGVLYSNGKQFDSSWSRGQATQFPLTGVVPGFTQGIGGAGKVTPMRVGGRRVMILPAALAYGSQAQSGIPANSTLVFVVDLKSIDG